METIRVSMEWIALDWKKHLACLLITMVSGVLLLLSISLYRGIYIGYASCDGILEGGVSQCGAITVFNGAQNPYEFNKMLPELEGVRAAGTMDTRGCSYSGVEELIKIQQESKAGRGNPQESSLEAMIVNPGLLPMCRLELQEGYAWDKLDHSDDRVVYLYLGSAYRDVPVGTRYDGQPDGTVLEVAGILREGFRFFKSADRSTAELSAVELDYTEDCTYRVICIKDYALTGHIYVCAEEGYEIEEVMQNAKELAGQMGLENVYYYTFSEMFEGGYKVSETLVHYMVSLIIICLVCSFLVTASFRVIAFWEQAGNLGIMLAMGFSQRFLLRVYLVKDTINAVLAFLGMVFISSAILCRWFIGDEPEVIFRQLFLRYLFPAAVLLLLAEVAFAGMITYLLLKKNGPAQLVKK